MPPRKKRNCSTQGSSEVEALPRAAHRATLSIGVDRSSIRIPQPPCSMPCVLPNIVSPDPLPERVAVPPAPKPKGRLTYREYLAEQTRKGLYADLRTEQTSDERVNQRLFRANQKKSFPKAVDSAKEAKEEQPALEDSEPLPERRQLTNEESAKPALLQLENGPATEQAAPEDEEESYGEVGSPSSFVTRPVFHCALCCLQTFVTSGKTPTVSTGDEETVATAAPEDEEEASLESEEPSPEDPEFAHFYDKVLEMPDLKDDLAIDDVPDDDEETRWGPPQGRTSLLEQWGPPQGRPPLLQRIQRQPLIRPQPDIAAIYPPMSYEQPFSFAESKTPQEIRLVPTTNSDGRSKFKAKPNPLLFPTRQPDEPDEDEPIPTKDGSVPVTRNPMLGKRARYAPPPDAPDIRKRVRAGEPLLLTNGEPTIEEQIPPNERAMIELLSEQDDSEDEDDSFEQDPVPDDSPEPSVIDLVSDSGEDDFVGPQALWQPAPKRPVNDAFETPSMPGRKRRVGPQALWQPAPKRPVNDAFETPSMPGRKRRVTQDDYQPFEQDPVPDDSPEPSVIDLVSDSGEDDFVGPQALWQPAPKRQVYDAFETPVLPKETKRARPTNVFARELVKEAVKKTAFSRALRQLATSEGFANAPKQIMPAEGSKRVRKPVTRGNGLRFGQNPRALNIALIRGEIAAGNNNPLLRRGLAKLVSGRGGGERRDTRQRIRML